MAKANNPEGINQYTKGGGSSQGYKYSVGGYFATKKKNAGLQMEKKSAEMELKYDIIPSIEGRRKTILEMQANTKAAIGDRSRTDVSPDFYPSLDRNLSSYPGMLKSVEEDIQKHKASQNKARAAIKEADAYKPVSDAYAKNLATQTKQDVAKSAAEIKAKTQASIQGIRKRMWGF